MQIDSDEMRTSALVVVIENDNLDRMRTADPITLQPKQFGGLIGPIKYPENFGIVVAFEEESGKIYELRERPTELLNYLRRGMKFKSRDGIHIEAKEKGGNA